jgi:DNA end-binding protein Ku
MAPRSVGNATVSFGLVSIPVKLYTSSQQVESISFRMLHGKCKTPLKQQYVCPTDGETVDREGIVKGYEFAKGQFVLFSAEEIAALEEEVTNAIAIEEFVPLASVDPVFYDRAYYLGPDKGGDRAYRLLSRALVETGLGGLARYAVRGKHYLVLVRPVDGGLCMQQLRYGAEVRPFSEVPVGNTSEVKEAELELALQLLRQTTSEQFRPEKYTDSTLERFQEVLQKKVQGETLTVARGDVAPAKVIDLMEALKASLSGSPGAGKAAAAERPSKTAPVKSGQGPAGDNGDRAAAGTEAKMARRGPTRAARGGTRDAQTGTGERPQAEPRRRRSG